MAAEKELKLADVKAHNTRSDIWFVVGGNAYDVTKFLDEHPGGEEVLLEQAGQDATEAFEDVGHSSEARAMLKNFYKGKVVDAKQPATGKSGKSATGNNDLRPTPPTTSTASSVLLYFVPVVVIIAVAYSWWSSRNN